MTVGTDTDTDTTVTLERALEMLRRLPPHERLRVIAIALPEVERELAKPPERLDSLRGLWKQYGPAPSAEEIDEARCEAWANFPRDDV